MWQPLTLSSLNLQIEIHIQPVHMLFSKTSTSTLQNNNDGDQHCCGLRKVNSVITEPTSEVCKLSPFSAVLSQKLTHVVSIFRNGKLSISIYVMFVMKNKQLPIYSLNMSIYLDYGQELVKL